LRAPDSSPRCAKQASHHGLSFLLRAGVMEVAMIELVGHPGRELAVTLGEREGPRIGLPAKAFVSNVGGFETGGAKGLRQRSWEILVDEESSHLPDRSHLLGGEHLRRVTPARRARPPA
jgi:hypothetical protein